MNWEEWMASHCLLYHLLPTGLVEKPELSDYIEWQWNDYGRWQTMFKSPEDAWNSYPDDKAIGEIYLWLNDLKGERKKFICEVSKIDCLRWSVEDESNSA